MKSGVTTQTMSNLLIGPGAVYKNFSNPSTPGTLLGATSGGNTFKIQREYYYPEVDGLMGPLKGSGRVVGDIATIEANFVEVTKENLLVMLAGSSASAYGSPQTHWVITSDGAISAGNYIDAIAIVGEKSGSSNAMCFVIQNAIASEPVEVPLGDGKGTVALKVVFQGTYDQNSPTVPPYKIYQAV